MSFAVKTRVNTEIFKLEFEYNNNIAIASEVQK